MAGPVEQFAIKPIVELGEIGGQPAASTNSALFLVLMALTALELLMAVIQACVFTMLTCIYLNNAVVTSREGRPSRFLNERDGPFRTLAREH